MPCVWVQERRNGRQFCANGVWHQVSLVPSAWGKVPPRAVLRTDARLLPSRPHPAFPVHACPAPAFRCHTLRSPGRARCGPGLAQKHLHRQAQRIICHPWHLVISQEHVAGQCVIAEGRVCV